MFRDAMVGIRGPSLYEVGSMPKAVRALEGLKATLIPCRVRAMPITAGIGRTRTLTGGRDAKIFDML